MATAKKTEPSQTELDVETLKKQVAYLEEKTKKQGSTIQLMHSMVESSEGMIKKMNEKIKKLAETLCVAV